MIITSHRGWFEFHLREIWQYRDLLKIYIQRNIITEYKQTILGPFWIIIPPVLTTLVFTIIFGEIANISTELSKEIIIQFSAKYIPYFDELIGITRILDRYRNHKYLYFYENVVLFYLYHYLYHSFSLFL